MNIAKKLEQELAAAAAGMTISAEVAPRILSCRINQCDPLAVSLEELRLASTELAGAGVADLQRLSESISDRLTYLLEPIAPIESDAGQCVVQMRSKPPQQGDDGKCYYELLVRQGGDLTLTRYRKEPGQPRRQIAATITKEVLLRLTGDLDAALDDFVA